MKLAQGLAGTYRVSLSSDIEDAPMAGTYDVRRMPRMFGPGGRRDNDNIPYSPGTSLGETSPREWVNDAAAGYHLPAPATTPAEAIMAFIKVMRLAAAEDKRNEGFYKGQAHDAADRYVGANAPIWNVLQAAVDLTKGAPGAQAMASKVLRDSGGVPVAAGPPEQPKSGRRRRRAASDGVPSWAPWAAGGVAVLALLSLVKPR